VTAAPPVSMVTPTAGYVTATRQEQKRKYVTSSQDSVCARWGNTDTHTHTYSHTHAHTYTRPPALNSVF